MGSAIIYNKVNPCGDIDLFSHLFCKSRSLYTFAVHFRQLADGGGGAYLPAGRVFW